MADGDPGKLTALDHAELGGQMILELIPLVGPLIDKATFGVLQARRLNRVEATLRELADRLKGVEHHYARHERFLGLLEGLIPVIAQATDEARRECLRDLLLNAATRDPDLVEWGESELAARLVSEIDRPGLELLAAAAKFGTDLVTVWMRPSHAAFAGEQDFGDLPPPPELPRVELNYSWIVLTTWFARLNTAKGVGLVQGKWQSAKGGFAFVLTDLGRLVINWALRA